MAGKLKPNIANLGEEVILENISYGSKTWPFIIENNTCYGLFDGKDTQQSFSNGFGWAVEDDYIQFTTHNIINIWRYVSQYGYLSSAYQNPLKIFKKNNNNNWIDISNDIKQTVSVLTPVSGGIWEKTISNLSIGTYKITGSGKTRIDDEWYIEKTNLNKFLIQDGIKEKYITAENTIAYIKDIPYDISDFNKYGIDDTSKINSNIIKGIENQKYKLSMYKVT